MGKKHMGLIAVVLAMVSLGGPAGASAATEFGDNCVADQMTEATVPATLFALTAAGNPLSLTAPSTGVVTKWKINHAASVGAVSQTLKVLRQTGPLSVQVVGESAQIINLGLNTFDTRIPIQVGDRLGLYTSGGPLVFCGAPGPENRLAVFQGGGGAGSGGTFGEIEAAARVSVAAIIEPDADNDGFGDETQDKCPQSAAAQAACPVITLSASAIAKNGLVTVLITSGTQAPVTVTGTVRLGKGKTAELTGGTQVVLPGAIARFTLLFPKKLKDRLKQLSPKQRLTLNLSATAVNVTGQPSITPLKVKLKGQAKPKPKKKPRRQAKS